MALLPPGTALAYVTAELPGARAWAARRGYEFVFDESTLCLRLPLVGRSANGSAGERYLLKGNFDDYRAVPPAWQFVHPDTGADIGPSAYPAPPQPNPRGSGLFLASGPTGAILCAHFNRLAYTEEQGPHGDWGPPTNWLNPPPSAYTRAESVGDMLARIELEVRESTARMAPLR